METRHRFSALYKPPRKSRRLLIPIPSKKDLPRTNLYDILDKSKNTYVDFQDGAERLLEKEKHTEVNNQMEV